MHVETVKKEVGKLSTEKVKNMENG